MQKSSRFSKFLKIVLGLSIFLTLFFQLIKPTRLYQNLDQSFFSITSYFRYVLFQSPVDTIKEGVNGFVSLQNVHDENLTLRNQILEVHQLQTRLIEANKENQELKDLLGLQETMSEAKFVNANVIERTSTSFSNNLLLNKGKNDGIDLYMAVVTPQGLIGQISEVSDHTAIVTLLTSQEGNNQFAVKIQLDDQQGVEALLSSYNINNQMFEVNLLDSSLEVQPGMQVVTSGLGEIIPSGLLVGEVVKVTQSEATLSIHLEVEPAASFANINAVMVVSKP